jgi:2-methylcitrate dehydratase PrpD
LNMTRIPSDPVTFCMADYARAQNWGSLTDTVRVHTQRAWVNFVACATGGALMPSVDAAVAGLLSMGAGEIPSLGRYERTTLSDAALIGSLAASAHTYDDTHLSTITHPTGPVASAILATAYQLGSVDRPVNGEQMLNALAIGLELECRVSCAIKAGGANMGWYMTGLSGAIGAAAAVGRLLNLTHTQMVSALGLAASQAGGLRAAHGSMAITFVPGLAARDGVVAAHLAATDYACSAIAIDGRNGLLQVLTGGHDASLIRAGLGERFESLNNAFKPYPCGIVVHPAIDACLHLQRTHKLAHQDIEKITLRVHPDALTLCWRKLPETVLDAQVSLYHWVGASLVYGSAGIAQGTLSSVMDPAVRRLQECVEVVTDSDLQDNQAVVKIHLRDGREIEHFTRDATGSVTNPMSDQQLATKFLELVVPVLGARRAQSLLAKSSDMTSVNSAAEILQLGAR